MKNYYLILIALAVVNTALAQKEITVDDFTTKSTFAQKDVQGINWMKEGMFYSALANNKITKYNITTGAAVEIIFDGESATPSIRINSYSFSADEKKILLLTSRTSIYRRSFMGEYYVYDITTKTLTQLSTQGKQSYAMFSPNGSKVAFVRANNLFYVDLAAKREVQVTNDGKSNEIINGTTDWVYEEEFSFVIGFYWSPDGQKLAYYRFDETSVKEYTLQLWAQKPYPADKIFKYPKAGEANSSVEIWFYNLNSQAKVKAAVEADKDFYIPRVKWTQDPNKLSIRTLNRLQNKLQIIHADAGTGVCNVVLTEESPTYVDIDFTDDLDYLNDGKHFIYTSEASGYKHLYLYTIQGAKVRQITTGNFEVSQYLGLDEKTKTLYYTSTEVSPLERHFYSITLNGKKKTQLSKAAGIHRINASGDFQFYIDHHHSSTQPMQVSLYKTKGNSLVKVLEKNEALVKTVAEYGLATKELFSFKASDGTTLEGQMLKPNNFDASKKYPVLIYQYSGPGSQNVSNSFGGAHFYFHQMLVQKGYIVAIIDTRGTGSRGEAFKKLTYKQLGKYELEDHITGAKFLASLDYVDGSRIGIWGWSYGGYMTTLAMTKGGGLFKMGIAVSPVTNWRFYDTVYTERYLRTPQLNASGYDENSPSTFAKDLQGNFLLIHGTGDDNVHFQNSVVLQDALINAGKQFQSFYYPDKHHVIQGEKTRFHLYSMMVDYVLENL